MNEYRALGMGGLPLAKCCLTTALLVLGVSFALWGFIGSLGHSLKSLLMGFIFSLEDKSNEWSTPITGVSFALWVIR